jgi:hypothetical protein
MYGCGQRENSKGNLEPRVIYFRHIYTNLYGEINLRGRIGLDWQIGITNNETYFRKSVKT